MIINQFFRFLKDNKIYDYYIIEFNKENSYRWRSLYASNCKHNTHNLHEFLENLKHTNGFIREAFPWMESTTISYRAWHDLAQKWEDQIYCHIKT